MTSHLQDQPNTKHGTWNNLNFPLPPVAFQQIQISQSADNDPIYKFGHPDYVGWTWMNDRSIIYITQIKEQGQKFNEECRSGVAGA